MNFGRMSFRHFRIDDAERRTQGSIRNTGLELKMWNIQNHSSSRLRAVPAVVGTLKEGQQWRIVSSSDTNILAISGCRLCQQD